MNNFEPQTVPLAIEPFNKRYVKRTRNYWMNAQNTLLEAKKVLQLREENLEKLLKNSFTAIAHKEVNPSDILQPSQSQLLARKNQGGKIVPDLVEKVTKQMRLFRHKAAIIEMGLVLLTVGLVSSACLLEKTVLLISSCLLLGLLFWSIGLASSGSVMGRKLGTVVLMLAAAIVIDVFYPYLKMDLTDYPMITSYSGIFWISCGIIGTLSIISVASVILRSTTTVVAYAIPWGFLLPIVLFANLLWIRTTGDWYHDYCTDQTAGRILALADTIFTFLTIYVVWREGISYRGVNTFLTDQDLQLIRSYTLICKKDPNVGEHGDGGKWKAIPEGTCNQRRKHKARA